MSRISRIFEIDRTGFNVVRGLVILAVMLLPLVVLRAIDEEQYWLSVSFGALVVGLSDPGGAMGRRLAKMVPIALIGAVLTFVGFGVGANGWGWVALATFVVALLAGLAIKFGSNRFVAAILLNTWFVLAIGLVASFETLGIRAHPWNQTLAWLVGSALSFLALWIAWLVRGRTPPPKPVPEIPGDLSPRPLTRPVVAFAVLRAVALTAAAAIAFGFHLPNAYWMPLAAAVAMKPDLDQSRLIAEQRVIGTLIGALLSAALLLAVDDKVALEVAMVALFAIGGTIRTVNYAFYTAAVASGVLVALGLPNPTNYSAEVERVLYTLLGVAIGVAVMLFATKLKGRTAKAPPQAV